MPLFRRPDGRLARDVPPYRRIMPYLMRGRTESTVYFDQEVDLTRTLPFIERWNATHERRITVFHVFLWAAVQTIAERPRLNRFVSGGRIYERDGIWVSFSAKKALSDDAPIVVLKRRFEPDRGFEGALSELFADVDRGRGEEKSGVDKELSIVLRMPGLALRLLLWLQRRLDASNLLPGSFIRSDPMYASLFIANLGSLKIDAAYHHLYEYGNIPIFAALGRVKEVLVVDSAGQVARRTVCDVRYSFDERVEDGLYCARALDLLRRMVEDPSWDQG
ncbi:MAG: 2-oxo acid dehydrogenase subunit E2 [Deltaproteobacteria bacterium]|nr:2-oxo acid dehydrogenase subunit E2 [Deltaproteobacteria bacterium]